MTRLNAESRFWTKVNKDGPASDYAPYLGPCWLWTGAQRGKGYGAFKVDRRMVRAHRFAYELLVGPIAEGLDLDHLCRVRHCVRPSHMEPVTPQVNILRGVGTSALNAKKTHCPLGHPYDATNTYHDPRGKRYCRACWRARDRRQARKQIAV